MNRMLLAASAVAMMTSAAAAADLPSRKYAPVAPVAVAPVFTWTGFYAGVNAGAAWANQSGETLRLSNVQLVLAPAPIDADFSAGRKKAEAGFSAGGQVGYNYQIGQFVLGAELDYNWSNAERRSAFDGSLSATAFGWTETYRAVGEVRSKLNSYGTLRARVGVLATPELLIYATGGVAVGQIKSSAAFEGTATLSGFGGSATIGPEYIAGRKTKTQWGWTLGAGAEYAISKNWSIKGEYLYIDLGNKDHVVATSAIDGFDGTIAQKNQFHIVRAGVNYRF